MKTSSFPPLRLADLYPSLLNVAGDGGNLTAVQKRCAWRGITTKLVSIGLDDAPDFTAFDMVFFHGGQDVEMAIVASDLHLKKDSLHEAASAGVVFLAVCAGLQLLGHRYIPSQGESLEGIGLLDLETRGGSQRFMQHAAVEVVLNGETETVVGFENHSGVTELGSGLQPFGRVVAGAGNNGRDGTEGAVHKNVVATYLHGPLLPKNPRFTDYLIRKALERKVEGNVELSALDDTVEQHAHAVALNKALLNKGQRTAVEPAQLTRTSKLP